MFISALHTRWVQGELLLPTCTPASRCITYLRAKLINIHQISKNSFAFFFFFPKGSFTYCSSPWQMHGSLLWWLLDEGSTSSSPPGGRSWMKSVVLIAMSFWPLSQIRTLPLSCMPLQLLVMLVPFSTVLSLVPFLLTGENFPSGALIALPWAKLSDAINLLSPASSSPLPQLFHFLCYFEYRK